MADNLRVTAHTYGAIEAILTAVYGRDVRQAIYDALRGLESTVAECVQQINALTQLINDLGLTVVDGKLCVVYNT